MFHPFALLGYLAFVLVLEGLRHLLSGQIFKGYSREDFWKAVIVTGFIQIAGLVVFQAILLPLLSGLPYCCGKVLVKKGRNAQGIQRFFCKDCKKSFLQPQ